MIKRLRYRKWKKIIENSGLFDVKYYLFTYPDVRLKDINPIMHYIKYGANEGRNPNKEFDTSFYLTNYSDVKESKMNPLVHYILYGSIERREINNYKTDISSNFNQSSDFYREDIANGLASTAKTMINSIEKNKLVISNFYFENFKSMDIKSKIKELQNKNKSKMAIILHIFYPELIEKISQYLKNIEEEYILVITFPKNKTKEIKPLLNSFTQNRVEVEVEVENKGYDILPFLRMIPILKDLNIKYFCKIHTKRDHDDLFIGQYWRESLYDGVLGSSALVKNILNSFNEDNELYMVGSSLNYISYQASKYDNETNVLNIANKLNINFDDTNDFGFIAGSIFWGRVDDFVNFSQDNIEKFMTVDSNSGQVSSIFHAYERAFGLLTFKGKKIGLVDYELSYQKAIPILKIELNPKPLIKKAKYRYQAFKNRNKYFEYLLLKKANILDASWCYYQNVELIDNWEDCFFAYIDKKIDYISQKHQERSIEFNFNENGLLLNNGKEKLIRFDKKTLSENITDYKAYDENQLNKDSDITVSIICTTYNHEQYIEQALETMATQKTNFKYEILVGDDCSTDNTANIVKKMYQKYPKIIVPVLRDKNIGPKNNHLDLFNKARGKYIALNEGDDYWIDKNKLQFQVDYFEKHPECSVCFHPVKVIDENDSKSFVFYPEKLQGYRFNTDTLIDRNLIQTNSVMYRGNIFKNYILNPLLMPGDWYRHLLNSLHGEIHFIAKVMSVYRKHGGGIWSRLDLFNRAYSIKQIVFYDELNKITNQEYHNELVKRQLNQFGKLYWFYFQKFDLKEMFDLIFNAPYVAKIYFLKNNINIDVDTIKNQDDLIVAFRKLYKINVVITSYNHENDIKQAIESVICQKGFFSMKLIVADDCSPDNTYNVILETLKNYEENEVVIFEKTKNLRMLRNMKRSFDICDGEYTSICEGDDYWIDEMKLHKQLVFMLQNPDVSMCFNWILLDYVNKGYREPHPVQASVKEQFITFEKILNTALTANFSCCFYKTESIKKVPSLYYEQDGAADWLFNLYISTFGKVGFIKDIMSVYRVHNGGQWSRLSPSQQEQNKQLAYKKYLTLFPEYEILITPLIKDEIIQENKSENTNFEQNTKLKFNFDKINLIYNGLELRGWIFNNVYNSYELENKYLLVVDINNKIVNRYILKNVMRSDLLSVFKSFSKSTKWAGFSSFVSFENLNDGKYSLALALENQYILTKYNLIKKLNKIELEK